MPNPVLETIAGMVPKAEEQIEQLRELIAVAEGAQQDVTAQKAELATLEMKLANWKTSLQNHGYKVT